MEGLLGRLCALTPAQWCQAYYVLAASACLGVAAIPGDARRLLLDYGPRTAAAAAQVEQQQDRERPEQSRASTWFVGLVATFVAWAQVPHSWFVVFYYVSLACSLGWLYQYLSHGAVLHAIASSQASAPGLSSMTMGQVAVAWGMMVCQAGRRVYEHATFIRPSASKMLVLHWVLGLSFYICTGVAVWVEGSRALLTESLPGHGEIGVPSLKTTAAMSLFLFGWLGQYQCHKHLAGLKKYSLPTGGMFRYLICPHYTCECLIYLSLAMAASPAGQLFNQTLLTALLLVAVNLGMTTVGTRSWYVAKFGAEPVRGKWNMIPFIF